MKNILSIAGGLLFALLFHNQLLGINVLLFSAFLLLVLLLINRKIQWSLPLVVSACGLVISAVAITWHGATTAVWSYFACLFMLLGYLAYSRASVYISLANGLYNILLGIFHDFLYPSKKENIQNPSKTKYWEWALAVGIPLTLIFVFISFYRDANPVFDSWVTSLFKEFEMIDFLWFFTASVATFLMLNIIQPQPIKELMQADASQGNFLIPSNEAEHQYANTELRIGSISMIVLNILLVFVLISEFMFLANLSDFAAADLSKAVHQGVNSSIVSVVIAISLIAFVFRGAINWLKSNKTIKLLATGWMILNTLLLFTIAVKTWIYISSYGLTDKRIGVLVYLILCLIGIVTVFMKVHYAYNFVFLIRKNLSWSIAVLALLGWINWSAIISNYNIQNDHIDMDQLFNHLPQNALVLKKSSLYNKVLSVDRYDYKIENKINQIEDRNWQEFNYIFYKTESYEK